MAKQQATAPTFTPGDFYKREDGVIMVEIRPGVYVNETTALTRHGIVPRVKEDSVSREASAN